ncbi:MAG: hypothetical protein WA694_09385, partial [Pseudolabrys sp.]
LGTQERAVIVLEGWDTAGKGGIVRRLGWADPRSFKVHPISAPSAHDPYRLGDRVGVVDARNACVAGRVLPVPPLSRSLNVGFGGGVFQAPPIPSTLPRLNPFIRSTTSSLNRD